MDRRGFLTSCAGGLSTILRTEAGAGANGVPSKRPIVIDAHAHHGYMGMWGQRDIAIEETLAAADETGIDMLCLCSIEALSFDMENGNRTIYQLMKRYPERIVGFATLPSPYFGKKGLDEIRR